VRQTRSPTAVTAAAHKLARIVFHMLKTRESYDESVFGRAEQQHLQRMENRLKLQAKALGFTLTPAKPFTNLLRTADDF